MDYDFNNKTTLGKIKVLMLKGERGKAGSGALVANTANDMTDKTQAYLYTGTTGDGYTNGHWYYWDGSDWTDGGEYTLANVDTSLDTESENAVQNKVITAALAAIENNALMTQSVTSGTSANNIIDPGIYFSTAVDDETQTGSILDLPYYMGFLFVFRTTGSVKGQLFIPYKSSRVTASINMFFRTRAANNTWNAWLCSDYVDDTLARKGASAEAAAVGKIFGDIKKYGSPNLITMNKTPKTSESVSFAWDAATEAYKITGTKTIASAEFYNIYSNATGLPDGIVPGVPFNFYFDSTSANVVAEIWFLENGELTGDSIRISTTQAVTIPVGTTGILVRLYILPQTGVTFDDTAAVFLARLSGGGGDTYTNEYNVYTSTNTYNIASNPTISAVTPYVLQASGDQADRKTDIEALLATSGVCVLGSGDYYVSNVVIPENGALFGCGNSTRIIMLPSATGNCVELGTRSTLKNVYIFGGLSYAPSSKGTRNGLAWVGTFTGHAGEDEKESHACVEGVEIYGFNGSGFLLTSTGTNSYGMNVTNLVVDRCYYGIEIPYYSEYHRFSTCHINRCRIGVLNNGGNNMFVNCSFDKNSETAFMIDNTNNMAGNLAHGSVIGSTFNHTGSNDGTAIKLINFIAGFAFVGCHIFFGTTDIKDATGVIFDSCNYGDTTGITCDNSTVFYNSCVFKNALDLTRVNSPVVRMNACYRRNGDAVTLS